MASLQAPSDHGDSDDLLLGAESRPEKKKRRKRLRGRQKAEEVAGPEYGADEATRLRPLPLMSGNSNARQQTAGTGSVAEATPEELSDHGAEQPAQGDRQHVDESAPAAAQQAPGGHATEPAASGPSARSPIMEIVIHSTSTLKSNRRLSHPVVRVSIVDTDSGRLFPKLHSDRPVISYYENEQRVTTQVLPIQTQPFQLRQHRTLAPNWQESLFVNEDMSYFMAAENMLLLFEILDFLPMNKVKVSKWALARKSHSSGHSDPGWHCVAWAFLKLNSSAGGSNTGNPVQLQLFKVPNIFSFHQQAEDGEQLVHAYRWWKSSQHVPYAAKLTVTVREHLVPAEDARPSRAEDPTRSVLPYQQEVGRMTFEQMHRESEERVNNFNLTQSQLQESSVTWSRLPGQACDLPNMEILRLASSSQGCTAVKFSHSGRLIAAASGRSDLFGAVLYEIPGGYPRAQLLAHHNIVYDLCWSADDKFLASASADGTVRIWNVLEAGTVSCQVLPHPCFVYAAQYHPTSSSLVVTGGFDKLLRVWTTVDGPPQLCQELDGHAGMINALCFDAKGTHVYSGDSQGAVIVWNSSAQDGQWFKIKVLQDPSLVGVSINSLSMAQSCSFLLVHSRDSTLRMFHCHTHRLLNVFKGLVNWKERIRSCFSPCGGLVFSGSEEQSLCVWDSATGLLIHEYEELAVKCTVVDVDYHPHEHMIAFCSHAADEPILVFKRDLAAPAIERTTLLVLGEATVDAVPQSSRDVDIAPTNSTMHEPGAATVHGDLASARSAALRPHSADTGRKPSPNPVRKLSPNPERRLPSVPSSASRWSSSAHKARARQPASSELPPVSTGGRKEHMSFSDVAAQSIRLQKLAAKLDAVLKENEPEPDALVASQAPPVFATPKSSNIRKVKAQLDRWKPLASIDHPTQQRPSSEGQSSLGTSPYPYSQTRPSTNSELSWNTVWEGSPLPMDSTTTATSTKQPPKSVSAWKAATQSVVATFSYEAAKETELSFDEGETMRVLQRENEHWWYVEASDGRRGYIPVSYVAEQGGRESQQAPTESDTSLLSRPPLDRSGRLQRTSSTESKARPVRLKSKYRRRLSTTQQAPLQEDTGS